MELCAQEPSVEAKVSEDWRTEIISSNVIFSGEMSVLVARSFARSRDLRDSILTNG